jgi:hypothetical protein
MLTRTRTLIAWVAAATAVGLTASIAAPALASSATPSSSATASLKRANDVTYAPGSSGSVQEIFARNSAGTVYENWENSGGTWNGWVSLGGTP